MPATAHADHTVITFDRPHKRNSMDLAAWQSLGAAVTAASQDPTQRAIVLRGDERSFCAGNDIDAMSSLDGVTGAKDYFVTGMLPTFHAIAASPLPVIAVVEGAALGGGVELVTWSDVVIAGEHATFALPEARIGVWATVYLGAMPATSSRRLGARMALAGDTLGHAEARDLGLATYAVGQDELDATLAQVLDGVRAAAPDALARSKRWLNRELLADGLAASEAALVELAEETLQGGEFAERMDAFYAAKAARSAARVAAE
ncbi:enoyl-CoA hydratase/isomerase family protein [Occultella glacieicola]|uniref:Enoyl-CoA hydratase/isomerase family protein n=1 Tax=Occultella glacieicola TaxID=2518684 RepID=A0ABY2E4M8_9MICO|nr:enoyl-CoA hydratase/isomerase family protein [Occultella glacieicola]TDE94982.1 enoyl-CoA hydratase/isomerase family protein [Occultella glacieicola]